MIGCFMYVPRPEIEPTTLVYQGDTVTTWATRPGFDTTLICLYWHIYLCIAWIEEYGDPDTLILSLELIENSTRAVLKKI